MQISFSCTQAHSNGAEEVRQTQQPKVKHWQDGRTLSMQAGWSFVIPWGTQGQCGAVMAGTVKDLVC